MDLRGHKRSKKVLLRLCMNCQTCSISAQYFWENCGMITYLVASKWTLIPDQQHLQNMVDFYIYRNWSNRKQLKKNERGTPIGAPKSESAGKKKTKHRSGQIFSSNSHKFISLMNRLTHRPWRCDDRRVIFPLTDCRSESSRPRATERRIIHLFPMSPTSTSPHSLLLWPNR